MIIRPEKQKEFEQEINFTLTYGYFFFCCCVDEFFFGCHREACASSSRKANKVDSRDVHCLLIGDGLVDERER